MNDAERSLTRLDSAVQANFTWIDVPYLQAVINALEAAEPGSARYVGGCVRDSLFGAAPKDFDIATSLAPDVVVEALKKAGLGAAPTGIAHGTVTAISEHHGVEVTTLRADVSTDGRRATVAFTSDWATDATRRDFRLNAIYLTPDLEIFDPVGGLADIAERRVRFIGQPEDRIREDYLRILRFFRFSARFADEFDSAGLNACSALKDGIETLSAERIGQEMMAILSLPNAASALRQMKNSGILAVIFDEPENLSALASLKKHSPRAPAELALAALYDRAGNQIGARLRLSNAQKSVRTNALRAAEAIAAASDLSEYKKVLYRAGHERFFDGLRLCAARGEITETAYADLTKFADSWAIPVFPYSGKDVVAAGIEPGPAVSQILSSAESQWIDEDFPPRSRLKHIFDDALAAARPGGSQR